MPESPASNSQAVERFLARWHGTERAERANKDLFLTELCDLLELPHPDPARPENADNAYVFERGVPLHQPDGRQTTGKIDLYRRGCFVLEAKQASAAIRGESSAVADDRQGELELSTHSDARATRRADPYGRAMLEARAQAERYIRFLPDAEPTPPFLVVVDVGHSFELFADFTQKGRAYLPYPDARTHRIALGDLREEKVRKRLRALWLEPLSLDPARASADVTREAAKKLAALAASFERAEHPPRAVAGFLTRCLFCMFAEDVGLLPRQAFRGMLESMRGLPHGVAPKLEVLFRELNTGTPFSTVLNVRLLHFNGGLFAEGAALPMDGLQLGLLIEAASLHWSDVEPAIFGTLLERALDPDERHKLGAHYTPRAYVERLVLPAVIEPLRADWANVLAAALSHAEAGRAAEAQAAVFTFHRRLCSTRVLDPACGSGNFLYVALAHFKLLEGEVLDAFERFGGGRRTERGPRAIGAETVDPHQFLGLEINPRAAALAELVLWIGYLQWHFRTFGQVPPAEPVLKNFRNIEHRDAVLAHDGPPEWVTRAMVEREGPEAFPGLPDNWETAAFIPGERAHPAQPLTLWDRRSLRLDPATGREVPDETRRVPFHRYHNPRPAAWPQAEFIVGNPPFLGNKMMRSALGDAYAEVLRSAYPEIPETADFVMYWWHKAALEVRSGRTRRFGLITTNSIRQTFNRSIVLQHLRPAVGSTWTSIVLRFAIPDHPWVDTADGASVRISMTVASAPDTRIGGEFVRVAEERAVSNDEGEVAVSLERAFGEIGPDLTIGSDVSRCVPLRSNRELSFMGAKIVGDGFVLSPAEARKLGLGSTVGLEKIIKPFRNGRDLTEKPRGVFVIDLFGYSADDARNQLPAIYEHLVRTVKPLRDSNKRTSRRENWWLWGETIPRWRKSVEGLRRYVATSEVGKHRFFVFLESDVIPDGAVIATNFDDAFHFGVMSSRIHVVFALRAGGRMGVGNDPRYQPSRCFDPFPFPDVTDAQKAAIRALAEALDAHRKRAQAEHGIGLTTIYNVLEKLRAGEALTAAEELVRERALVSTLRQLHDQIDAAVAAAYGWPWPMTDEEILEKVVALNAARAAEEARGFVRWLRPEFQAPEAQKVIEIATPAAPKGRKPARAEGTKASPAGRSRAKPAWPKERAQQVEAVAAALRAAPAPVTAADLASTFARGDREAVAEILAALVVLGRAHRGEKRGTFLAT